LIWPFGAVLVPQNVAREDFGLCITSAKLLARPERLELPTPRFVVWCSIQLSYGRSQVGAGCSGTPAPHQPLNHDGDTHPYSRPYGRNPGHRHRPRGHWVKHHVRASLVPRVLLQCRTLPQSAQRAIKPEVQEGLRRRYSSRLCQRPRQSMAEDLRTDVSLVPLSFCDRPEAP
jgi:hypothetical protein